MLARKIEPPSGAGGSSREQPRGSRSAAEEAEGRWRTRGRVPTLGPGGVVRWWERPAPGGDELLWEAVVRLHEQRQARGLSITRLAELLAQVGHAVRRETLSRVLNGNQPTSWDLADAIAQVLGVSLSDLHERRLR